MGLAMEEGRILEWHAAEGAEIARGQDLVDIETTKITNTLQATDGGTVRRLVGTVDEVYPCGALIAVLAEADVPDADIDAFVASFVVVEPEAEDDAGPEFKTIEAGGLRFRYVEERRRARDRSLPPWLRRDLLNWMFVQPEISANARTIALDLPGHGASSKDLGGIKEWRAWPARCRVPGGRGDRESPCGGPFHGRRGGVALAKAEPGRVASLTLLAPAGLGAPVNTQFLANFIAAKRRRQMTPVAEALFADPSVVSTEMVEEIIRFKRLDGVEDVLKTLAAALADPGSAEAPAAFPSAFCGGRKIKSWPRLRICPPPLPSSGLRAWATCPIWKPSPPSAKPSRRN